MQSCFERQRAAYLAAPEPNHAQRVEDLNKLAQMLKEHREAVIEAINQDYGNRSTFETLFAEFFMVLDDIKSNIKHLKKWMKPQKRKIDLMVYPTSSNRVIPQPLGRHRGDRAVELSADAVLRAACRHLRRRQPGDVEDVGELEPPGAPADCITPKYFPPEKLQFFEDGGGLGPAFSSLPFDHLFFTGSGQTGKAVMANAARNLTPVTLELGGKSPAVVAPDFPMALAADRIMWSKAFNAGQICTNVDYTFIPAGTEADFEREAQRVIAERYPDINHPDYTSVIDQRSYDRLQATLDDAIAKGARVVNLFPGQTPNKKLRKFPLHLVFNVSDDMDIMQREIFGPLLPVKTYASKEEVASYVNQRDRPLALYPFTKDRKLQDYYVTHIMSGGVSINTALLHVAQHDIPFGGVGGSGMGHYHGYEGFLTFSKLRPVYRQGFFAATKMMLPPYDKGPMKPNMLIDLIIKLKG